MIVLYHDYTSAASAVAALRLQRVVEAGHDVRFEGLDVLGLDAAIPPTPGLLDGLERHRDDLRAEGIEPARPEVQPPTLGAHLVGGMARDADLGASWRRVCYRAYWQEGADLSDPEMLAELAAAAGLSSRAVAAVVTDRSRRLELRQRMLTHRGEGVGGVPVLGLGGTYVDALIPEEDLRELAAL